MRITISRQASLKSRVSCRTNSTKPTHENIFISSRRNSIDVASLQNDFYETLNISSSILSDLWQRKIPARDKDIFPFAACTIPTEIRKISLISSAARFEFFKHSSPKNSHSRFFEVSHQNDIAKFHLRVVVALGSWSEFISAEIPEFFLLHRRQLKRIRKSAERKFNTRKKFSMSRKIPLEMKFSICSEAESWSTRKKFARLLHEEQKANTRDKKIEMVLRKKRMSSFAV